MMVVLFAVVTTAPLVFLPSPIPNNDDDIVIRKHLSADFSLYYYWGTPIDGYDSLHISHDGQCRFVFSRVSAKPDADLVNRRMWSDAVFSLASKDLNHLKQTIASTTAEIDGNFYDDRTIRDGTIEILVIKNGSLQRTLVLKNYHHADFDRLTEELDYFIESRSNFREQASPILNRGALPDMRILRRFCPTFAPPPS